MAPNLSRSITSWGRLSWPEHEVQAVVSRHQAWCHQVQTSTKREQTWLPFGNGRSYGDSNLNPGGGLLLMAGLDRFIHFDPATGLLRCEAGVLLSDILRLVVPQGWFLPVTPGTQLVTVGGAIANDVHGKNHHVAGSFGNHVQCLELLRSDGERRLCSPTENADWFAATIGGLGLTGVITWAEIQLKRVANPFMDAESIRFQSLEAFFEISEASERDYEYTVSWIDCAFTGRRLGRGLFNRANHAPAALNPSMLPPNLPTGVAEASKTFPFTPPLSLINSLSLKAFNTLYFNKQKSEVVRAVQHYRPFFYPLDALLQWNRIYGPQGFYQYQCAIPPDNALAVTRQLLEVIAASGMGSFLAVLKQFGQPRSRGLLSFPMPGTTLALDFPNQGPALHKLFAALDQIVLAHGGRLYPAKDGRMPAHVFKAGYPALPDFIPYVDPRMSSGFWRRVMETPMKKVLIIGATSAIAQACARRWAQQGDALFLAARHAEQLQSNVDDLKVRGAKVVASKVFDANALDLHAALLADATQAMGGLTTVLIAHGTLTDQPRAQTDVNYALAEITTNGVSVVSLMSLAAEQLERQGHGAIAVISSVAGDRGRQSNYVYGSAKALVSAFASGLRQRLAKKGVNVITIKPGFVDTPMTAAFKKGALWAKPDQVAKDIVDAVEVGKSVVYTPGFWRFIMLIIKSIPEFVFIKLTL